LTSLLITNDVYEIAGSSEIVAEARGKW